MRELRHGRGDLIEDREGVETEGQLERLRLLRCDLAQGYHFSEPVTDAEFDRFLEPRWSTGAASPN